MIWFREFNEMKLLENLDILSTIEAAFFNLPSYIALIDTSFNLLIAFYFRFAALLSSNSFMNNPLLLLSLLFFI